MINSGYAAVHTLLTDPVNGCNIMMVHLTASRHTVMTSLSPTNTRIKQQRNSIGTVERMRDYLGCQPITKPCKCWWSTEPIVQAPNNMDLERLTQTMRNKHLFDKISYPTTSHHIVNWNTTRKANKPPYFPFESTIDTTMSEGGNKMQHHNNQLKKNAKVPMKQVGGCGASNCCLVCETYTTTGYLGRTTNVGNINKQMYAVPVQFVGSKNVVMLVRQWNSSDSSHGNYQCWNSCRASVRLKLLLHCVKSPTYALRWEVRLRDMIQEFRQDYKKRMGQNRGTISEISPAQINWWFNEHKRFHEKRSGSQETDGKGAEGKGSKKSKLI